ncbi:MAG: hypothetical protein NTU79_01580 [Planctomycetota bacterium]|nr:hypothetical protein [Planctomycetota bacterium]
MAMEEGGRADKLGNEYESLFVVQQMLLVVAEEAESIKLEGLGEDEQGVDIWVYVNGLAHGYQCKRENSQVGKWTVGSLGKVLKNSKFQLDRGPNFRFSFVSSDPVPSLSDFFERTQSCDGKYADFVARQVTTSKTHEDAFRSYCDALGLDSTKPANQEFAFDYLSRTEFVFFDKPHRSSKDVERFARQLVDGPPNTVISTLKQFAIDNIGNTVTGQQIRQHLKKEKFEPTYFQKNVFLSSKIEFARARFQKTITPLLIADELIPRTETEAILDFINSSTGPRIIMIHGDAGVGKSGVLYELVERLSNGKGVCLPVRLDRQLLKGNTTRFGKDECDLPGSPAKCLRPYLHEDYNVLVIDQLDAIRLTDKHSPTAMTLFEELVEEALAIPNCRVVVACRTFDLEDNQLIKSWVQKKEALKHPINFLTDRNIQDATHKIGGDYSRLTEDQIKFLRVPQNLYLWSQTRRDKEFVYDFDNPTDLFRQYWVWVEANLEFLGVASSEMRDLLNSIVASMDSSGKLVYPIHLARTMNRRALEALQTLNVLRQTNATELVFAHQSQFDYLSAERVSSQIRGNELTLPGWLEQKGQSLFCREQLRLILSNLRDTANHKYIEYIEFLTVSPKTRFHVKFLAFSFLGSAHKPTDKEAELVKRLIDDAKIREHVIDLVLFRRPAWIQKFIQRGYLNEMRGSNESWMRERAYAVQRSVSEELPSEFIELASENLGAPDPWPARLRDFIFRGNEATEPVELFQFRLAVIDQTGELPQYVNWEKLPPGNEYRLFEILRRFVKRFGVAVDSCLKIKALKSDSLFAHSVEDVVKIANRKPVEALKLSYCCMRYVYRLNRIVNTERLQKNLDFSSMYKFDQQVEKLLEFVTQVFVGSGKTAIRDDYSRFVEFSSIVSEHDSELVQRSLISIWQEVDEEHADAAVIWLASAPELRFAVGRSDQASRFAPTEEMIRQLADKCSKTVLDQLQEKIEDFRDTQAHEDYKRYLKNEYYRQYHDFHNEIGLAKFVLFSAIPSDLRSAVGQRRVDEGNAKFGGLPKPRTSPSGGLVQSSIPQDRLQFVTDQQWLEIVKGDWSKRGNRWRSGGGIVREASHEQFSSAMGNQAEREPGRFANLALKLRCDSDACYLSSILWSLQKRQPPKDQEGKDLEGWERPTHEQVVALLRHVEFRITGDFGRGFCNIISSYGDVKWPDDILEILKKYALDHPDPEEGSYAVSSTEQVEGEYVSMPDYDTCAINSVRPLAARAIGHILYDNHDVFSKFESTIDLLVADSSPFVRIGSISACLPILNFNRDKAVQLFLAACDFEDAQHCIGILGSHNTNHFLRYALHSHLKELAPIILAMKSSSHPKLQMTGAKWIVSEWLRFGGFADELENCIYGNTEHRKGAASMVANFWNHVPDPARRISKKKRWTWLWEKLNWWDKLSAFDIARKLFDDPEKEVGELVARMFCQKEIFENRWFNKLVMLFMKSKSFSHSLDDVTSGLNDYPKDIVEFSKVLFSICERITDIKNDPELELPAHSMADYHLPELLLRLYHQSADSKNKELNRKCLDAWDSLLYTNFGNTRSQLGKLDTSS